MMTEKSATIGKKSQLRIVTIGMREGNTEKFYLELRHFRHETNFNLYPLETYRVELGRQNKVIDFTAHLLYCTSVEHDAKKYIEGANYVRKNSRNSTTDIETYR